MIHKSQSRSFKRESYSCNQHKNIYSWRSIFFVVSINNQDQLVRFGLNQLKMNERISKTNIIRMASDLFQQIAETFLLSGNGNWIWKSKPQMNSNIDLWYCRNLLLNYLWTFSKEKNFSAGSCINIKNKEHTDKMVWYFKPTAGLTRLVNIYF